MNPIMPILEQYPALVIDGALATELERRGCDLKDDLWSAKILLEQPEKIQQVHYDYFKAGADCAITASYQATIEGWKPSKAKMVLRCSWFPPGHSSWVPMTDCRMNAPSIQ